MWAAEVLKHLHSEAESSSAARLNISASLANRQRLLCSSNRGCAEPPRIVSELCLKLGGGGAFVMMMRLCWI